MISRNDSEQIVVSVSQGVNGSSTAYMYPAARGILTVLLTSTSPVQIAEGSTITIPITGNLGGGISKIGTIVSEEPHSATITASIQGMWPTGSVIITCTTAQAGGGRAVGTAAGAPTDEFEVTLSCTAVRDQKAWNGVLYCPTSVSTTTTTQVMLYNKTTYILFDPIQTLDEVLGVYGIGAAYAGGSQYGKTCTLVANGGVSPGLIDLSSKTVAVVYRDRTAG